LSFAADDPSGPRAFTTALGSPRVEIDDDAPIVIGFSGDGRYVAYERFSRASPPTTTIRRAPASGPLGAGIELAPARSGLPDQFSLVSPDSNWIAHLSDAGSSSGVVVTSFGGASSPVAPATKVTREWTWSSTNVLAFIDDTVGAGLFVVDATTGTTTHVGAPQRPGEILQTPAWSPDGRSIAYSRQDATYVGSICVVAFSDLVERCTAPMSDAIDPKWSSDGTSIAFRADGVVYVTPTSAFAPKRVPLGTGGVYGYWWVHP
jgi:hypothetical protein